MGRRGRNIGWCLLLASSLAWLGCHPSSRRSDELAQTTHFADASEIPPPLQIPDQSASFADPTRIAGQPLPPLLGSTPSLLPPLSERQQPLPHWPPTPPSENENNKASPFQALQRLATARLAGTSVYIVRLRRREQAAGKQRPEEQILFKYRQQPLSIHMRWLGSESKDREVLYVRSRPNDMLYILPGIKDSTGLKTTDRRPLVRLDTEQGLGNERYPVLETGIGALIERFGQVVFAAERSDAASGIVKSLGSVKRPEFEAPLIAVLHLIPAGVEQRMPRGGQRLWYFDAALHFPVLVIAHDASGQEAEYYCFDRFLFPARIPDAEFDPTKMGRH